MEELVKPLSASLLNWFKGALVQGNRKRKAGDIMKYTLNDNKWTWHNFHTIDESLSLSETDFEKAIKEWRDSSSESDTNCLQMDALTPGKEHIRGSLIYQQTLEDQQDYDFFHFFLTREFLITVNFKFDVIDSVNEDLLLKQMDAADNAIEGFFVFLGQILDSNLTKIDGYEKKLNDLLWKVKQRNSLSTFEEIYESRHELLVWKNLTVPFQELKIAAEEAFGDFATDGRQYQRTAMRTDRALMLIREYQQEIATLVHIEEVVSAHRGNEIMKTLTVLTTLFTPITALGAIWGMNFKLMPELEWKWGYLFAIVLMIVSTIGIYLILRSKGWMGDILKGRKKNSFFK
jgi:magnesium transporter